MKYENRLLAFFDILGFKNILETQDIDTLYEKYTTFIEMANEKLFGDVSTMEGSKDSSVSNFNKSIIFSDSILLISYDIDDMKNINQFILGCVNLMQEAIKFGFILRGAIGYGDAIYDEEKNIFLSKEFAELYVKEGKQNWAGCGIFVEDVIKQKILTAVFGNKKVSGYQIFNVLTKCMLKEKYFESNNRASSPILEYEIPSMDEKYFCLNYLYTLDKYDLKKLFAVILNEPKGKYSTTKAFYDYIFSLDDIGEVFQNLEPIHKIKIMMTQTSASVKFEDEFENGTNFQGQNITIGFI